MIALQVWQRSCARLSWQFNKSMSKLSHCPATLMGLQALEIVRVAPIQRIPRYVLLLKELAKVTPADHEDSAVCARLVATLERMLSE